MMTLLAWGVGIFLGIWIMIWGMASSRPKDWQGRVDKPPMPEAVRRALSYIEEVLGSDITPHRRKKMTKFLVQKCDQGVDVGPRQTIYANSDIDAALNVVAGDDLRRLGKLGELRVRVRAAEAPPDQVIYFFLRPATFELINGGEDRPNAAKGLLLSDYRGGHKAAANN
jgi:hypothetical protein